MPVDRGAIDAQLKEIGEGERWWEQREFRELPHILHADERIRGITTGKLLGPRRPRLRPAGTWLIVATDQRLLCLRQERFARKQVDVAAGEIVRIQQRNRLRAFQVTVVTPLQRYRLLIPKADAFRFAGALAPLMPNPAARQAGPDAGPLSWIPGMSTVAALPGVSDIVAMLAPPPDSAPRGQVERLEATVERLQHDVERLQQQVGFLEDLLQKQAEESFLPRASAGS